MDSKLGWEVVMRRSQFAFVPTVVVLLLTVGSAFPENPVSAPLFARGTSQWQTSVASDGTRFLVAWSDYRSGVGEIRVTRADANGSALTPEGIPISTTNAEQATVAWDGRDYIVVWQGDGGCYYKRITADGAWLDSSPRLVLSGVHSPRIARSDYGTIVIGSTFFGSSEIAVIGTVGIAHAPIRLNAGSNAVVGCGRTDCLVAWSTYDANLRPQIVGRRISADGRLLDGEPAVLVQDAFDPRLTSNGSELLLTWREPAPPAISCPCPIPVVTSSIASDGVPSPATPARSIHGRFIDGAPFIILSDARRDVVDYTVTAGQGEFIVGWEADLDQVRWLRSGKKRVVEAARVSASGNVGARFPLIQSMISSRSASNRFSIATTGRELFACWTEDVGLAGVRVAGGISHGNDAVVPSLQIGGATKQSAPAVAYGAGQYAVVWLEDRLGTGRRTLMVRRFTATLAPIDQNPVAISGDGDAADPHVAFDGTAFVLVWNEGAPHARWFSPDGSLSAPLAIDVASFDGAIATHDGQTALLSHAAFVDKLTVFVDKLTFTLLERDRTIKTLDLGRGGSGGIHLAWNGTEYIAAESNTKVLTIRSIRADGVALAPVLYRVDADWSLIESPAIGCGGNECVAAWWTLDGGVTAVRLRGAQAGEIGEPFTDLGDFRAAPVDRFYPEVVSMADDFLVTSISKGTLFARSISSGVYGNEQQLFSTAEPLLGRSVAAGEKKQLVVAYVRAAHDGPYAGAQRVFLRVLDMR
jgi:hypothetical protein